jgi:hypothetical protein
MDTQTIPSPANAPRRGPQAPTLAPSEFPEDGDTQEVQLPSPPTTTFVTAAVALCGLLTIAGFLLQG